MPKFDYNYDKSITWSKYIARLRKLNPDLKITPELADDLLENDSQGMNNTKNNDSNSVERKNGIKITRQLEALKRNARNREAPWESERKKQTT